MSKTILRKQKISEKSSKQLSDGKYTFVVNVNSNKTEITRLIEEVYQVKVKKINTLIGAGKKRRRGRVSGQASDFKKAVVTLIAGQVIDSIKN